MPLFKHSAKKTRPICYVLVFDQIDIIKKSLTSLTSLADELDIVVIENPSKNSPEIAKIVDDLARGGRIVRYYRLKSNIAGEAYRLIMETEAKFLRKYRFTIITDGDLAITNRDVIKEIGKILSFNHSVFACGVSLDLINLPIKTFADAINWVPKEKSEFKDYFEGLTGCHLLAFRSKEIMACIRWLNKNNLAFVDDNLHEYCYKVINKSWARTKWSRAYHLTWDLYNDIDHPYTKLKTSKSFTDTWHQRKTSEFSLIDYID